MTATAEALALLTPELGIDEAEIIFPPGHEEFDIVGMAQVVASFSANDPALKRAAELRIGAEWAAQEGWRRVCDEMVLRFASYLADPEYAEYGYKSIPFGV